MAVVLRLARHGRRNHPFYRVVVAENSSKRDGRYVEVVGTYNTKVNPSVAVLKLDRIKHWLDVGARPSLMVRSLITKQLPGVVQDKENHQIKKIQERRKARKVRAKAKK